MRIADMASGGPIKHYGDLLDRLIKQNRSVYVFHAYVIVVENIQRGTLRPWKRSLNSEKKIVLLDITWIISSTWNLFFYRKFYKYI